MEKGYRDYGHDIDNTDGPLEAGFGFALALDKPDGFVGRDAVLARKQAGPLPRRLVQVQCLDPEPLMYHAEVVRRERRAGRLRARRLVRPHAGRRRRAGDGRRPAASRSRTPGSPTASGPSRSTASTTRRKVVAAPAVRPATTPASAA